MGEAPHSVAAGVTLASANASNIGYKPQLVGVPEITVRSNLDLPGIAVDVSFLSRHLWPVDYGS